ncbi:MAG: putative capsular polysaccharide synthesis family protein [Gammaproteobacteria bacterium]
MISKILNNLKKRYYKYLENQSVITKIKSLKQHIAEKDDLILVHQMGRAASMTVTNTIRTMHLQDPVYHTHWLNAQSVKERVARVNSWKNNGAGPLNVRVAELLSPEIHNRLQDRKWKIISIVREPVARNVSAFFLDIERFFDNFFDRYEKNEITLEEMKEVFINEFPHDMPLNWFEVEMEEPFGVDVFSQEYNDQKGYMVFDKKNVSVLVIKLERLESCYKHAFRDFFGKEPYELVNTHVTDADKNYGMYKDFLREVELPESYLDRMYDCAYVRHFFTEEEIQGFRNKWTHKH